MEYRIGMIGSPQRPNCPWTDETVLKMKSLGFNALQLNVAWGARPGDEALNLEDVVVCDAFDGEKNEKSRIRQDKLKHRLALCKKHGMRSIFHFGAPYNGWEAYAGKPLKSCIQDKSVTDLYLQLLDLLGEQIPGIDDILLYTYDQDAWLCSEFYGCEACRGVPLDKRLPEFLRLMTEKWKSISPEGILWWEPWELSAGQTLAVTKKAPAEGFGLMLHSNVGEVQKARAADLWLKNISALCKDRKIPAVAEIFLSEFSEETEPLKRIPCPSLTYEQIRAVTALEGICGIKEYFGNHPDTLDPCLEVAGEVMRDESRPLSECIDRVAEKYGRAKDKIKLFWEHISKGYTLYPWDCSWFAREVGNASLDHGWRAAFIRGQQCSTPSWDSTRHGVFMKTDDLQPHPWMLEDISLRCGLAAEEFKIALDMKKEILALCPTEAVPMLQESFSSVEYFMRVCVSYALHLRQTNVAMLLREDIEKGRGLSDFLVAEMEELLRRDIENQNGGRVEKIYGEFQSDRVKWLEKYLNTDDYNEMEKGYFSLTTR